MPIPLLPIFTTVFGLGPITRNIIKQKEANDTVKEAQARHQKNIARLEGKKASTTSIIEQLDNTKSQITDSFIVFSNIFEKIKNRPKFNISKISKLTIPEFNIDELNSFSFDNIGLTIGRNIALTFIAGGIVSGLINYKLSKKASDQANEIWDQMLEAERQIDIICDYLDQLYQVISQFDQTFSQVNSLYQSYIEQLKYIVNIRDKVDWNTFTKREKLTVENTVLLVALLFDMCKVQLVSQAKDKNSLNIINETDVTHSIEKATTVIAKLSD